MQDRRIGNSVIVLRRHYQNLNGFCPREQQVFGPKSHFKSQYIARPFVGRQSSFHEQAPNCNSCTIDTRNCETSLLLLPHAPFRTIKTLRCAPALLDKNRVTPIGLPCRCAVFRWGLLLRPAHNSLHLPPHSPCRSGCFDEVFLYQSPRANRH